MAKDFWLVKQEPGSFSWATLVKDGRTDWTGVRNFQARNHLRAMKKGDAVLFYHSGEEKQIVGLARVEKEAYPDPTADEGDWSAVDIVPVKPLPLVRQSRLSVSPVTEAQFERILSLGGN
jgi:predicted RNA-binding protein with PUA-like domain